jgi:PAS domain S-box-containing protein
MENKTKESSLNILLVEDNPGDVYIIRDQLKHSKKNYNITHSSSLTDALKMLANQDFDAVLLDLGLPDSFGMETLERIKVSSIKSPIIVLTGLDDEDIALKSLKEGAQDYLVKGKLDAENIGRAIRYGIERKKIQDSLKLSEKRYRELNEELEQKVLARTEELSKVNTLLQDELEERKIIEEIVRRSEERYRTLIDLSPSAILVNRNNRIVLLNTAAIELFAATDAYEILGKSPFDLFHPDYHETIRQRIHMLLKDKPVGLSEEKIIQMNGAIRDVEVVAAHIVDAEGSAIQIILHDITDRKKKENELQKLNQTLKALGNSSQAMARAGDEDTYLKEICKIIVNDCGYKLVWIGFAENNKEKSIRPIAHAGFDQGYMDKMNLTWSDTDRGRGPTGTSIRTGKIVECKNMLTDPKFKPWREEAIKRGYMSSIAIPILTRGEAIGVITIYSSEPDPFMDDEKQLLTEIAHDLAYGVSALRMRDARARDEEKLRKYAADLKNLNATKDKFFGIIAHDLRNPFTTLLGASELLTTQADSYDLANIKKFSRILNESAKQGYALLENLLEWAKAQTGSLAYAPQTINVKELVAENLYYIKVYATNKQISLQSEIKEDTTVVADKNMLNTVIRNLLHNALKFTHPGGSVSVHAENNHQNMIISVKDSGIGIPKKDLDKLFRIDIKFTNQGTAQERGTGLGLILCKEFVEKFGGKIWVESTLKKGSVFKFTVPVMRTK